MSIHHWFKIGILNREVALYKKLIENNIKVTFLTYGDEKDLQFEHELGGIEILCNKFNLPNKLYKFLMPLLHFNSFLSCDIIKTNQMNGSLEALKIAKLFCKPLICRMGYLFSDFQLRRKGEHSLSYKHAVAMESKTMSEAKINVVTTKIIKKKLLAKNNKLHQESIRVIPNYVNETVFKPYENSKRDKIIDILFIGRIVKQKNIESLLIAVSKLNLKTQIIGSGNLKKSLQSKYNNKNIIWNENIPSYSLPEIYNSCKVFVLPSYYEGHPKTLIEAMSCGCAVLGANTTGIAEIINHGQNGILCKPDSKDISSAIINLLQQPALRGRLGFEARKYILRNNSLNKITKIERNLYSDILMNN